MVTPGSGGGSRKRTARHLAEALPQPTRLMLTKDLRIAHRCDSSERLLVMHGRRSASRSSALAATAQGRRSPLPDLSVCSSQATTGEMAAPSRMEQSVEVPGGPSQLVQLDTEAAVDERYCSGNHEA